VYYHLLPPIKKQLKVFPPFITITELKRLVEDYALLHTHTHTHARTHMHTRTQKHGTTNNVIQNVVVVLFELAKKKLHFTTRDWVVNHPLVYKHFDNIIP